jgi:PH/SEC7 domain-containing protein
VQSTPASPIDGTPSFMETFTPPVPPLPNDSRRPHTATTSPIADIFANYGGISNATKPLPPIHSSANHTASEESLSSFDPPDIHKKSSKHVKQRSMSVGEIESKKAMVESSLTSSPPPPKAPQNRENRGWDTALNGILNDFQGELSQLDPITSILELRDPSIPARRAMLDRPKADRLVFPYTANQDRGTPTLTLQPAPSLEDEEARKSSSSPAPRSSTSTEAPPIVPPRSSSLTPTRSGSGSSQPSSPRTSAVKYSANPLRPPNGYAHTHSGSRDSARLRMHHRSSASSSEPSLVAATGEGRIRELPIHTLALLTFKP